MGQSLQYSMAVLHGLTSDQRNVFGSLGRIPQCFVTRSLHWQESATYFSMHTLTLILSFPLLCLSFAFHRSQLLFALAVCFCVSCPFLFNLSTLLSYFASRFFSPSLLAFIRPLARSLRPCFSFFTIHAFRCFCTRRHYSVVVEPRAPLFKYFSAFVSVLRGVLSSVLQVLLEEKCFEKLPCLISVWYSNIQLAMYDLYIMFPHTAVRSAVAAEWRS